MKSFQFIRIPFRIFYKFYCALVFAILMLLSYPVYKLLFINQKMFKTAFRMMRLHAKFMMALMFIRVKIRSQVPQLPDGPHLICPNHSSFLDIPCIYAIFNSYFTFIGKNEIKKWPLFRIFYTSGMNILVDRSSNASKVKTLRRMSEEIDQGNSLVVFPEGSISRTAPEMSAFKKGAFAIAIKKQVPIVPVVFLSNYKRLQRGNFLKAMASPGYAFVQILEPVSTEGLGMGDLEKLETEVSGKMQEVIQQNQIKRGAIL